METLEERINELFGRSIHQNIRVSIKYIKLSVEEKTPVRNLLEKSRWHFLKVR